MNAEVPIVYCQWELAMYVCVFTLHRVYAYAYSALCFLLFSCIVSWIVYTNVYQQMITVKKNSGSWTGYVRLC